jgi:hypothetical protein
MSQPEDAPMNGSFRRILPILARSGGGRLAERKPAIQPRRRERVKVPPIRSLADGSQIVSRE